MSDVKEVLDMVLHDEKLLGSRAFRDIIYTDQPIIKRASQIKTSEIPQRIKEMKAIAYTPEAYWKTTAWLFYTQGKFMESYTDVFELTSDFVRYYPTYRDLDTNQLRGYFSWRTRLRHGDFASAPIPFIYIYAYELINDIGSESPTERIDLLKQLINKYGEIDNEVKKLLQRWTVDYCVYQQLNPSLVNDLPDILFDKALINLQNCDEILDDELFPAIQFLSGYPFDRSRYYISNAEKFKIAAVRLYRSLSSFYKEHRKKTLCENLFGHPTEMNCHLFESAVFYERNCTKSTHYSLNSIHTYTCHNGLWRCMRYYGSRTRNSKLGELMKMLDYLLRERDEFRYKIRRADVSKATEKIIIKVLDGIDEEKRRENAYRIEIDLSKLDGIRAAAAVTRDKLIVEECIEDPVEDYTSEKVDNQFSDSPLNECEKMFLRALLNKDDWKEISRKICEMPSLLADSINEKLFDYFSDTVIDCSSDVPEIIDDYLDDLKNYIK